MRQGLLKGGQAAVNIRNNGKSGHRDSNFYPKRSNKIRAIQPSIRTLPAMTLPVRRQGLRARSLIAGSKGQADTVDAITLAASRRTIIKDVTQVCTAVLTEDLGATHSCRAILLIANSAWQRLIEARPTTTGVKFS